MAYMKRLMVTGALVGALFSGAAAKAVPSPAMPVVDPCYSYVKVWDCQVAAGSCTHYWYEWRYVC